MYWIDTSDAVSVEPAKIPTQSTEMKYHESTAGTLRTVTPAWVLNSIQKELLGIVRAGLLTPDKADDTQVGDALVAYTTLRIGELQALYKVPQYIIRPFRNFTAFDAPDPVGMEYYPSYGSIYRPKMLQPLANADGEYATLNIRVVNAVTRRITVTVTGGSYVVVAIFMNGYVRQIADTTVTFDIHFPVGDHQLKIVEQTYSYGYDYSYHFIPEVPIIDNVNIFAR